MAISRFVPVGIAAFGLVAASYSEEHVFATLLKRQAPGTPSYNCHDNCGTAITVSKSSGDVCKSEIFVIDYEECLQCAGPDNYDIWKYYGNTLAPVASSCGLDTEPLSGKQEDPTEALHLSSSSSASSQSASTSSVEGPAFSSNVPASTTPASDAPSSAPTYIDTVISTISDRVTTIISTVPTPSSNGTATFTSAPPQQTENAAALVVVNTGMFGAIVLGVFYGLGN